MTPQTGSRRVGPANGSIASINGEEAYVFHILEMAHAASPIVSKARCAWALTASLMAAPGGTRGPRYTNRGFRREAAAVLKLSES
jgi:hypothetical protein